MHRSAATRRGRWAAGLLLLAVASRAALAQDAPPAADPFQAPAPAATPVAPVAAPAASGESQPADPFATGTPPAAAQTTAPGPAAKPPPVPAATVAAPPKPQSDCCVAGIRAAPETPSLETVAPAIIAAPDEPVPALPSPTEATPTQPAANPPPTAAPVQPAEAAPTAAPAAPPITVVAPSEPPPVQTAAPAAEPPAPPPVALDHPKLADTATLEGPGGAVKLFGVVGLAGDYAEGLSGYIAAGGDRVTCQPREHGEFVCALANGTDIAMAALVNGAAQARADAPEAYVNEQSEAQAARRGIWASLPPPPVAVKHPAAQDTATLVADAQTYALDGVQGVSGGYATDMQAYIASSGDSLLCQPQGDPGHFVCLLPDGTDLAKVVLVNGAARVADDAPDAYRTEQAEAITNRRGIWQGISDAEAAADLAPPPGYMPMVEEPIDGLVYVGGVPSAVIDGSTVFFSFVAGFGWGYWDGGHHWVGAPGRFAGHLDHAHPGGAGLRGFGGGHGGVVQTGAHIGVGGAGAHVGAVGGGLHVGGVGGHGGLEAGAPGRPPAPGMGSPNHPAFGAGAAHPSASPFVHPNATPGVNHAGSLPGHQAPMPGHQLVTPAHQQPMPGRAPAMPQHQMPQHQMPTMAPRPAPMQVHPAAMPHAAPAFHAPAKACKGKC